MIFAKIALERRRSPRLPCALTVAVEGLAAPLTLNSRDVSLGGVFLYHPQPPAIDVTLDLRLEAPGRSLRLAGTVVHRIEGAGFGVRFEPLDETTTAALEGFLRGVEADFAVAAQLQNRPPTASPVGETATPASESPSS